MENDLKISLILSIAIHASIFAATAIHARRSNYIVVPIELFFANPPPAAAPSSVDNTAEALKDAEKEIVLPKKKVKPPEKKAEKTKTKTENTKQPEAKTSGVQGGTGTESRPMGPSSQISLDAARFPYTYYTNTIVKKVGRSWQWSMDFGRLKALVYFRIQRDGKIASVEVKTSSGDPLFDQQAVRAIKLADPFPPLPDGYADDSLGVYFEFAFK